MTAETRKGRSLGGGTGRLSPVGELVRRYDRDRYQTVLFAPAGRREALFALYAFNYEIARVREAVSQPMLGQIRLQWWREVVAAAYTQAPPRHHVVAERLSWAIGHFALAREHLDRLIDTRERDLAEEPPADLHMLEEYAEGTAATLLYLALGVLGAGDPVSWEVAREVGTGYALAGLLRAMPFHARAGRRYIPAEIAERAGLDPEDYAALRGSAGVRRATAEIADAAAGYLAAARQHWRDLPRQTRSLALSAIVADGFLRRLQRADHDPFAAELRLPDPLQSWRMLAASLSGRF